MILKLKEANRRDTSVRSRLSKKNSTSESLDLKEDSSKFRESQFEDALRVIDDAIYEIDDKVNYNLAKITGIKDARDKLYGAYSTIATLLKDQYPDSKLYDKYELDDFT